MPGTAVFILAGGRSTRMGRDKALLRFHDETLLERALRIGSGVSATVKIVGARERYAEFGAEVVEDEYQQCGPLGGIHAALGATVAEWNVLLAVDTPKVDAAFLRWLLVRAEELPEALAVVPEAAGAIQGTCAVYRPAFREVAERHLQAGNFRVTDALKQVRVEYLQEEAIRGAGFDPAALFVNLNTPEEFARAGEQ